MEEQAIEKRKGFIQLTFKNQGGFVVGLIAIFYGYFGIICNSVMYDPSTGFQIHKNEWIGGNLIIWSYQTYVQTFFIPAFILFFVCFYLTFKEDIPYYGIKSSIWLVPITILISFLWFWIADVNGIWFQPFILLLGHPNGYLTIFIIFAINLSGSLIGMRVKQLVLAKRELSTKKEM